MRKFLRDEFAQLFASNAFLIEQADGKTCLLRRDDIERILRPGGTVSARHLMALAEEAIYRVILPAIGPWGLAVPTSLNINFLRKGAPGEDILAAARLMKARQAACGQRGQPWVGQRIRSDRLCDGKRVRFSMVSLHHIGKTLFLLY